MEPDEASIANRPLGFVFVPVLVFLMTTVTPGTGALVSSITVPEIVFSCATENKGKKNKKGNNSLGTGKGILPRVQQVNGISNLFWFYM
jgi:hypothetical protein